MILKINIFNNKCNTLFFQKEFTIAGGGAIYLDTNSCIINAYNISFEANSGSN